ncbi:olfactory receptor 1F1-like [Bombina bombina]|uniref:olfactory receptor 1F1-like n=1 Tax=Bombina bombina TaxID=8345 RepID=UPI00235A722C|nr:olfactory receptor 1F1-like [Bombina bombina]
MGLINQINVTGFYIQGFSELSRMQIPLFILFLTLYLGILLGNMTVFAVVSLSPHLHKPMYIFLMNLSCIDITFTTNILPKLLHVLITQHNYISFAGCMTQMSFFGSMVCSEILLLTAMAYDRYIAIYYPLYYVLRMSLRHCSVLVIATWVLGFLEFTGHAVLISKLSFCASNVIEHIFCDVTTLLKLSCSDTFKVELLSYMEGALMTVNCFIFTLVSYVFIISAILNIQSSEGRNKAFSTCSSHLTSVIMFYLTFLCLYMRPTTSYSPSRDKFFALLYVVINPLMNPFIYTLKNKEFQVSLKKFILLQE